MSYPVVLDGARFSALVVGGGEVAERKARGLLAGGIAVTIVAPKICDELVTLAAGHPELTLVRRPYETADADRATIVVAATDDASVNGAVARDAHARGRLVNVVDDPDAGNFMTPAVHRSGDLTIAVSAGRLPAAAAAIRAAIAERFDSRYGAAIQSLRSLRERLLAGGRREDWRRASRELIVDEFCADVEADRIEGRVSSWR